MSNPLKYIKGYCLVTGASHGIEKLFLEWASRGVSILQFLLIVMLLKNLKKILNLITRFHV